MTAQRKDRSIAGFTMIEVVMALAIAAVVVSIAYTAVSQITRAKRLLDDERDAAMIANAILSRMTRELQLATNEANLLPPRDNLQKRYSTEVDMLGESKRLADDRNGDTITFMANEAGQYVPDGLTHSGIVQITYRVEKDPEQRSSKDATYYLIRDEVPFMRPYDKAYQHIMTFPITHSLVSFRCRYFDGEDWAREWDTERRALPQLVQFTVEIQTGKGKVMSYSTTVPIKWGADLD